MKATGSTHKTNRIKPSGLIVCLVSSMTPVIVAVIIQHISRIGFYVLLAIAGWLTWTWIEYFFHRFAMHPKSNAGHPAAKKHLHHHRSPAVFEVSLFHRILLFVFSCLFFYIAWIWNNYFTLFAGFFWGFAAFCYIHYLLHHKWVKYFLPKHHYFHICHHCKFPGTGFGVSVTWWDDLFATTPPAHFNMSTKAKTLYYL